MAGLSSCLSGRVFEYHLKLGSTMPSLRKRPERGKDISPAQLNVKKRKRKRRQSRADGPKAKAAATKSADLIDLIDHIDSTNGPSGSDLEAEGGHVEVADEGVDHLDETSSIASGPSLQSPSSSWTARALLDLCSACQKLYKRTKRMKGPLKNKLLNDGECRLLDQLYIDSSRLNSKQSLPTV